MISYLGIQAIAHHARTTPEAVRTLRRRHVDFPAPDMVIGGEITGPDGSVTWAAAGRPVPGWLPSSAWCVAAWITHRRRFSPLGTVRYVSVAQLATRWGLARSTVSAAITRTAASTPIGVDGEIRLARRVIGFLPDRATELDGWSARILQARGSVVTGGRRGRPRIVEPTGAEVARLVGHGLSWRAVAERTGLSHETARSRYLEHVGHGSGPRA